MDELAVATEDAVNHQAGRRTTSSRSPSMFLSEISFSEFRQSYTYLPGPKYDHPVR